MEHCRSQGIWRFGDECNKMVKILGHGKRIAFQRCGKRIRGLSISKDAFLKMEDVTLSPGLRMELESDIFLTNYGNHVHLVKYCLTSYGEPCDGGFCSFTLSEWNHFWNVIRKSVLEYLSM